MGAGHVLSEEQRYRGHRLCDLEVNDISWSEWSAGHLQNRTARYPNDPDELDIDPEWATEAALDYHRRLSITESNDLRLTGWSPHAPSASWSQREGRVLRVIVKPFDIVGGVWSGTTAAPASEGASNSYWRRRGSFGPA